MEDMERYGDYNEVDEAPKSKVRTVGFWLKILVILCCFCVVAFLGFRIYLFNYYPEQIEDIYISDNIKAYYEKNGSVKPLTQTLRAPYDDPDNASFFCDNLYVIRECGELQVSVRFNTSAIEYIEKELGLDGLSPDDSELLIFRLYKNGETDSYERVVGRLCEVITDSKLMYRYYKLVFDGIDFGEDKDKIEWIRLEIFVKGQDGQAPFAMIPIYENNDGYSSFKELELSEEDILK